MKYLIYFLYSYMKKYKLRMFVGFCFLFFYNYILSQIPPYLNQILTEIQGNNDWDLVKGYLSQVMIYSIIVFFSMFLMRTLILGVSREIEYEIRQDLFDKILYVEDKFYHKNSTGDIISRCTNDLSDVRELLGPGVMYIPNSLSRLFFYAPVLMVVSSYLFWIVMGMMLFIIMMIVILLPKLTPLYGLIQKRRGVINSNIWETIIGVDFFRLQEREEVVEGHFKKINEDYIGENLRVAKYTSFMWPFFIFLIGITQLLVLFLGGKEVMNGSMTMGGLFQYIVMVAQLTFPVLALGWVLTLIQKGFTALERIKIILDEPNDQGGVKIEDKPIEYEIENLEFVYVENGNRKIKIDQLSIGANEFIGITGEVGSGKTTFIHLLSGFLKPTKGEIRVNGISLKDIDMDEYRKKIALSSQTSYLFSKSVKENVALSHLEAIDDIKIDEILKITHLSADVQEMKEGIYQVVGEKGVKLSGGQVQRVSIARSLYADREILFMDDTLSSVDSNVEKSILENLRELKNKKLIFLVSNRISTLKRCNRILFFKEGEITEDGSHEDLVRAKKNYYHLYRLQQLKDSLK